MSIKKGWKITWISIGSLIGLLLLVVVVALWLVFTPSRLTKIVNSLAGNYITCEGHFGEVDLTLLSTFPDAGLKISDVVLVNPMEGAQNDTLARVGSLTVGIDVMAYLKEKKVIVHQVRLDDATANLYIAADGSSNFDIFPASETEEEKDTTPSEIPELIDLKKIAISNLNASFIDRKNQMDATVKAFDMNLTGKMDNSEIEADLEMGSQHIGLAMADSNGVPTLIAAIKELELEAEGGMKGDEMDADVEMKGGKIDIDMRDSTGTSSIVASLGELLFDLDAKGTMAEVLGALKLKVENGRLNTGGTEMVNETLQKSESPLLEVEMSSFTASMDKMEFEFGKSTISIADYALLLEGLVNMATDSRPMQLDVKIDTKDEWQVAPLLAMVPEQYMGWQKGMDVDGKVGLALTAAGTLSDSTMPTVAGRIWIDKGAFYSPQMLPYKFTNINSDLAIDVSLDGKQPSWLDIKTLKAHTRGTDVSVAGRVDDLMGDMKVDARVKGTLPLEDAKPMMPSNMVAKGNAKLDLQAKFKMSQLSNQQYDKMKATGSVKLSDFDFVMDTIHATAPNLDIAVRIPSAKHKGKMADATIQGARIEASMGKGLSAKINKPTIEVGVNNLMKEQIAASISLSAGESEATMDSTFASFNELTLKGSVRLDSTQSNVLKQYNPIFNLATHSATLYTPMLADAVRLSELSVDYKPNNCDIKKMQVHMGNSDFALYGTIHNLEEWMSDKALLKGDLNFTSSYADIDQLMDMFSGAGSDPDSIEAMRKEDAVPADANPFIVPKNVDITLNTHIQRSVAFGNDLSDVAGTLTVKDGVAVLDQMGFVCKAATMQLTAIYRSPRPSNLYAGIDFHLLDIEIDELLDMIPAVDTLVPMLSAFDGNANFHLAGESFLDAHYSPKMSTLKGAAAISGKDLVVMDNKSLARIAKLMRLKKWKEDDNKIRIDSIDVEMTVADVGFGSEIEVLPFMLSVGSYQMCVSGVYNLDDNSSYHIELLKNPLLARVSVDVKGSLSDPHISLGKLIYADLYKPKKQGVAEKRAMAMKQAARKALESTVR
jgi:hypothetical protein